MAEDYQGLTPPPELVQQWLTEGRHQDYCSATEHAIVQAARWGSDQELEACCEWIYKLMDRGLEWSMDLRAARRPAPPNPVEKALQALDRVPGPGADPSYLRTWADREAASLVDTIRRALEQLND